MCGVTRRKYNFKRSDCFLLSLATRWEASDDITVQILKHKTNPCLLDMSNSGWCGNFSCHGWWVGSRCCKHTHGRFERRFSFLRLMRFQTLNMVRLSVMLYDLVILQEAKLAFQSATSKGERRTISNYLNTNEAETSSWCFLFKDSTTAGENFWGIRGQRCLANDDASKAIIFPSILRSDTAICGEFGQATDFHNEYNDTRMT